MKLLLFLFVAVSLRADIMDVKATESNGPQLIIRFRLTDPATQLSNCKVRVYQDALRTVLVNDVNESLFPGSADCTRAENVVVGNRVTAIIGKRRSDVSNGVIYSRAVEVATRHYITIIAGSDTVYAETETLNPPPGNLSPIQLPFLSGATWNIGYPKWDRSAGGQTKSFIDPLSGFAVKRLTGHGYAGFQENDRGFNWSYEVGSTWTNPGNAITWGASTYATYSGSARDPLFLVPTTDGTQTVAQDRWGSGGRLLDDLKLLALGSGAGAAADDRAILVCLSRTVTGCESAELEMVMPSSAGSPAAVPSSFPAGTNNLTTAWLGRFHGWNPTASFANTSSIVNNVTVSGSTVTTDGIFDVNWPAGMLIYIPGSSPTCKNNLCRIASVANTKQLTIQESPTVSGTVQSRAIQVLVRVRKKTTTTDTISLNFRFHAANSRKWRLDYNGAKEYCTRAREIIASGPDAGRSVRMCSFPDADSAYTFAFAFFDDNAETRYLGRFIINGNHASLSGYTGIDKVDTGGSPARVGPGSLSATSAREAYVPFCIGQGTTSWVDGNCSYPGAAGKYVFIRIHYEGDWSALPVAQFYNENAAPVGGFSYTLLTQPSLGQDVMAQVTGQSEYITGSTFGLESMVYPNAFFHGSFPGTTGGFEVIRPILSFNFVTGTINYVSSTGHYYPNRWALVHSGEPAVDGVHKISTNAAAWYGPWAGPWNSQWTHIYKSGAWSTDTSLTATYAESCDPLGIDVKWQGFGATGTKCIRVRGPEVCRDNAVAEEIAAFPCPHAPTTKATFFNGLQPGDMVMDLNGGGTLAGPGERMRVLKRTSLGGNQFEFVLQRWAGCSYNSGGGPNGHEIHTNGWKGSADTPVDYEVPYAQRTEPCSTNPLLFGSDKLGGKQYHHTLGGHSSVGQSPTSGSATFATTAYGIFDVVWPFPSGLRPNRTWGNYAPKFAGQQGFGAEVQSYPSVTQASATPVEKSIVGDFRHLNQGNGVGPEAFSFMGTMGCIPSLVAGQTQTYEICPAYLSGTATVNEKIMRPLTFRGPYYVGVDYSGPHTVGVPLNDSMPWHWCMARVNGECVPGSTAGKVYAVVPKLDVMPEANLLVGSTFSGRLASFAPHQLGGWATQTWMASDSANSERTRRITQGFKAPSAHWHFASMTLHPTGRWGFMNDQWADAEMNGLLVVKLPPWPGEDGINRSGFVPVPVQIAGRTGLEVRVQFGYDEFGAATDYRCTSRRESCFTAANATATNPFSFASETESWTSASSNVTVNVPALSQHVLRYRVAYKMNGIVTYGTPFVTVVP